MKKTAAKFNREFNTRDMSTTTITCKSVGKTLTGRTIWCDKEGNAYTFTAHHFWSYEVDSLDDADAYWDYISDADAYWDDLDAQEAAC